MQYIDDTHYAGAAAAAAQVVAWETLDGKVPDTIYGEVLKRMQYQAGHAVVWRDAVTEFFTKMSGIPDGKGRVGHYPGRIEAESMKLDGYTPIDVTPWETASGGKAVTCPVQECRLRQRGKNRADGMTSTCSISTCPAASRISLSQLPGNPVDHWIADDTLPTPRLNGSSSTRRAIRGVAIHQGDIVRVTGRPDGAEQAPLDYLEFSRTR